MSGTRSFIIAKMPDGKYRGVVCAWDGYIAGVGRALIEFHNTAELAQAAVSGGHIVELRGIYSGGVAEKVTSYLARDKGVPMYGEGATPQECAADMPLRGAEYAYVWDGERWMTDHAPDDPDALYDLASQVEAIQK